jgi:hypothetical protein
MSVLLNRKALEPPLIEVATDAVLVVLAISLHMRVGDPADELA